MSQIDTAMHELGVHLLNGVTQLRKLKVLMEKVRSRMLEYGTPTGRAEAPRQEVIALYKKFHAYKQEANDLIARAYEQKRKARAFLDKTPAQMEEV